MARLSSLEAALDVPPRPLGKSSASTTIE